MYDVTDELNPTVLSDCFRANPFKADTILVAPEVDLASALYLNNYSPGRVGSEPEVGIDPCS